MSTKKNLLTHILRTLERIEEKLDTLVDNTTPPEVSQETLEKFGLTPEAEFLTEEETSAISEAEQTLYEDK